MKLLLKYLVVTALLSVAAFAQTTIVEYKTTEPASSLYGGGSICVTAQTGYFSTCTTNVQDVTHLAKFDTLEAAMQFMADHQDYKLLHFYSALVAVDVKVEEKTTSEPQPPIEKTEKVYKFGSLTKKKQDSITILGGTTGWVTTVPYAGTIAH